MDIVKLTKKTFENFTGQKRIIGKSVLGSPIYSFTVVKTGYPKLIVQSAMHAREYITAYLNLKLMERFIRCGRAGTVAFIPLINPDGVEIALKKDGLYKANARGVDLNVNFDARWASGKSNVFERGSENYVGSAPFSEPETKALRDFTLLFAPDCTISYHSKGQEIYYEFFQDSAKKERDFLLAEKVALSTGYKIKSTPFSAGGYKDWCVEKLKIPALTIEVGSDDLSHPIGKENLYTIYSENKCVIEDVIKHLLGE